MLSFLVGTGGIGLQVLGDAFVHAGVNVLAIGPVLSGVERLLMRLSDEDIARRGPLPLGLHRRGVG